MICCGLLAEILFCGIKMRASFISRRWFEEVDEGLVFRFSPWAHRLQFMRGAVGPGSPDASSAVLEFGGRNGEVFHELRVTPGSVFAFYGLVCAQWK
jgi:hypothetical protein